MKNLKYNFLTFLFILIFISFGMALNLKTYTISGKITDGKTGKPIEDVNVFIANSILGASTNSKGFFKIDKVPAGNHELVASMVGYYVKTIPLTLSKNIYLEKLLKLESMAYSLDEIEVVAERPIKWLNDLKKFKQLFLGNSTFAKNCVIENAEILEFEWTNNIMTARAPEILKIKNHDLGLEIDLVLSNFYWDKKKGKTRYLYRNRFYLMDTSSVEINKMWKENREIAYNGSVKNFFYLLINDNLENSGFMVFNVQEINSSKPLHPKNIVTKPYNFLVRPSLLADEIKIEFKNFIKIVYTKEAISQLDNMGDIVLTKSKPQVSWLKLRTKDAFVDLYGNPQGAMNFELFGYWGGFGVAEMLPKYFMP